MSAQFKFAFDNTLKWEGGHSLTTVPGDKGGMTCAGIARNAHPEWPGWQLLDNGAKPTDPLIQDGVFQFYRTEFWDRLQADLYDSQAVANEIYDEAVNAGIGPAVRSAQSIVGASHDGVVGAKTLAALNTYDPSVFVARYKLLRIARRRRIIAGDKSQLVFINGWLYRILGDMA